GGGTSVSADVACGRGSSRQQSVSQVDTVLTVSNHANISVGGDATMKGAHLKSYSIQPKLDANPERRTPEDPLHDSAQQRQT
ncbi:hypothetical protein FG476_00470, partial [Xylella fastidiosa subsp. multiplex]